MNTLSPELLLLLVATFLAAGMVKGIAGMGLPTVAMGLLGAVLPSPLAAALLVVPSFATNVWQLSAGPRLSALLARLWPMLLGIAVATVCGSVLLANARGGWSEPALGIALIVYAGYALLAPSFSVAPRAERWLAPLAGIATGLVTGATGVFVIPAVPYLQSLRLDKDELVQALGLSFSVSGLSLATGLAAHGAFHLQQARMSAVALVPALAGMWLGQKIRNRISPRKFRLCFLGLLAVLGLELVLRPML